VLIDLFRFQKRRQCVLSVTIARDQQRERHDEQKTPHSGTQARDSRRSALSHRHRVSIAVAIR
jgi:hypothetical protein